MTGFISDFIFSENPRVTRAHKVHCYILPLPEINTFALIKSLLPYNRDEKVKTVVLLRSISFFFVYCLHVINKIRNKFCTYVASVTFVLLPLTKISG